MGIGQENSRLTHALSSPLRRSDPYFSFADTFERPASGLFIGATIEKEELGRFLGTGRKFPRFREE